MQSGEIPSSLPRARDVYVRRLREKIEPDPENPRYLRTVRGAGYRFEPPRPEAPQVPVSSSS